MRIKVFGFYGKGCLGLVLGIGWILRVKIVLIFVRLMSIVVDS